MVREHRDPAWWRSLASSPSIVAAMPDIDPELVAASVVQDHVTPLASLNGGLLFVRADALGFVEDMHALFLPAGRGHEANSAVKSALDLKFTRGACLITVTQTTSPMSKPPLSFGFRPAVLAPSAAALEAGAVRLWVLTVEAWRASPAFRRL